MDKLLEGGPEAGLGGRRWVFGNADLDERSLELRVEGALVPLERKPLEVLIYLLHHAGEAVTKQELGENLWTGRILTDTVLTRCISQLRQALKDDERQLIRTVHGIGYRLVAEIKVEASTATPPPAFDFKPGDRVARRPQWRLEERLGTGGHGEAWLARHEKTGEPRVFKFALDERSLTSLKREITLYRLLHDALGERAAIVRILEWNLEEAPYFLETEYVDGRDLRSWTEAQGGLTQVALPQRLEIVAQVADALAAAHSVGVLHKDVKPGNVLIRPGKDSVTVKLCDFGSGSILAPERLEQLGITQHGFTRKLPADHEAATALYLAPEVRQGQPFTVQADVYSLGVMLYQMVVGDLTKAFAPQWEADVEDVLLREDIAAAAAGNPSRRLSDALQLGGLLRGLEIRRKQRTEEVAARQRAERMRQAGQSLRRTRAFALSLLVLVIGVGVAGGAAYRARNEAIEAREAAQALNRFLMDDVLHLNSGFVRPSEASYDSLLDRAATHADDRLSPEAAARLHLVLGRRYHEIGRVKDGQEQYLRSAAYYRNHPEGNTRPLILALDRLAWAYAENGNREDARRVADELSGIGAAHFAEGSTALAAIRIRAARSLAIAGSWEVAERQLRDVLAQLSRTAAKDNTAPELLDEWFGQGTVHPGDERKILLAYGNGLLASFLTEFADDLGEAERLLRDSLSGLHAVYKDPNELLIFSSHALADLLAERGQYAESEELLKSASEALNTMLPAWHYARALPLLTLGKLRLEQRRPREAVLILRRAVDLCGEGSGCPPRARAEGLWVLGNALDQSGNRAEAIRELRTAIAIERGLRGEDNLFTLRMRIDLARALFDSGDGAGATAELHDIPRQRLFKPALIELRRLEGLLAERDGRHATALKALTEAAGLLESRLGRDHWRAVSARADLARVLAER